MCPRIFGYQITTADILKGPLTLLDNESSPTNLINYAAGTITHVQLTYGLERNNVQLSGILTLATDGTGNVSIADESATTSLANFGVSFEAAIISGNIWIQYTTTSNGHNTTMTYYEKAWID